MSIPQKLFFPFGFAFLIGYLRIVALGIGNLAMYTLAIEISSGESSDHLACISFLDIKK